MKRLGNLKAEILADENLAAAFDEVVSHIDEPRRKYRRASGTGEGVKAYVPAPASGKSRKERVRSRRCELLSSVRRRIESGTFRIARYKEFHISEGGKKRLIQSPPIEDRIGVSAITRVLDRRQGAAVVSGGSREDGRTAVRHDDNLRGVRRRQGEVCVQLIGLSSTLSREDMEKGFEKIYGIGERKDELVRRGRDYYLYFGLGHDGQGDYVYRKVYGYHPTASEMKSAIVALVDGITDGKILTGFAWKDMPVYLSQENQFNYKSVFDLATQDAGVLPVKFKMGEDAEGNAVYHTFSDIDELKDFYTSAIAYIQSCLSAGWAEKDALDLSSYE